MKGSNRGGVGVRVFVGGADEAKRDFRSFRDEGKRAFSEIAAGAKGVNPALLAFSRTVHEGRTRVADLAESTGGAGRVLSSFGVAGIAASAALGGLAIALNQARGAMRLADEIGDSAGKLGIGTDALQEYRYAMHQAGGEAADADAAIAGFTKSLGAAESGLSPKLLKAFEGLGFTRDQLRSFDTADDALQAVAERIAGLSKESERAAVAEKLGLTPMLPLLRRGADGIADLREEARQLGVVMDEDLVARAGEANDKLEVLSQVIDVQLKSAFVELAPFIVSATEALADLLRGLADFLNDPRTKQGLDAIGRIAGAGLRGGFSGAGVQAGAEVYRGLTGPDALPRDFGMDPDDPDLIRHRAARATTGGARLKVPSGGGSKAKGKRKGKFDSAIPIDPSSILSSYDPATGQETRQRSATDFAFKDAMGFFPGEGPEKIDLKFDADVTTLDEKVRPWLDRTREDVRDVFVGGVEAAFSGDLLGFIKGQLIRSLAEGLGESLTNAWSSATHGGMSTGGGIGSFLLNVGKAAVKRNALGGSNQAGDVSSVAEYGEELAVFGRNGRVFSHDDTVRMLQDVVRAGDRGGGPSLQISYAPSYRVAGSGPELDRLRVEMQRDRDTFRGRVVGAVSDALQRRQIKAP